LTSVVTLKTTKIEKVSLHNLINKDSVLQRCDSPSLDELFPTIWQGHTAFAFLAWFIPEHGIHRSFEMSGTTHPTHIPEDSNTAVRT
jgi:hypothetical protein